MGSQTIAEFVDNHETVELLRELGVHYGQGYHLGRPGPIAQIIPQLDAVRPMRQT